MRYTITIPSMVYLQFYENKYYYDYNIIMAELIHTIACADWRYDGRSSSLHDL